MKLYLVRHAHAVSDAEDPARPLSPRGREVALSMGRWLRGNAAVDIEEVWHSPLVRARETAELVVEGARLKARLREADFTALSALANRALACASAQDVRALEATLPKAAAVGKEQAAA